MPDAVMVEVAKQLPALTLFVGFTIFIIRTGIKAVERRDKAFLKSLNANTKTVGKLANAINSSKGRNR